MKKYPNSQSGEGNDRLRGFTLLEMIGVLAVIAILAGVLVPVLVRQVDKAVSDTETTTLQSLAAAYQNSILRNRVIPGGSTWTNAIATEVGKATIDVLVNPRNQTRLFLIDTSGFGTISLPYTQSGLGVTPQPSNPRVMIVSSMGATLPTMSSSPSTSDFNNLWNSSVGTVPTNGAWAGWTGKGGDVIVQRINLAPLFIHVLLSSYNSTLTAYYSIDSSTVVSPPLDAYFLQNTVLNLNSSISTADAVQVLTARYYGFIYDQNVWRSSISTVAANTTLPDYSSLAQAFVNAPVPLGASGSTPSQQQVLNDMIAYMNAYTAWANDGSNFSTANSDVAYQAALAAYNTLNTHVTALVNASSP